MGSVTSAAFADLGRQLKQLEREVKKKIPKQQTRTPPVTKSGVQQGSSARRAAAGNTTKGTNLQAPVTQYKPPTPDFVAYPHLAYSFVVSGRSSLQGFSDPQELRGRAQAFFQESLGIEVPVTTAYYMGRRAAIGRHGSQGGPRRVYVQLTSPADGDIVRRNRCKLKGQEGIVADALTKEEISYQKLLKPIYEKSKAKGSLQFQRCRLFEKVMKEDGSMRKREITPWGAIDM